MLDIFENKYPCEKLQNRYFSEICNRIVIILELLHKSLRILLLNLLGSNFQ